MPTYVAVFALVLAYVALVAAYLALRSLAKLRQATALLNRSARRAGRGATESLIEMAQQHAERTEVLTEQVAALRAEVEARGANPGAGATATAAAGGLGNVALVRYDAFNEMSGRMSFSLALLDEKGDGVTISALAGRADTRVYAKGVAAGKGEHELSPEEQQAVAAALGKRRSLLLRKAG